MKRFWLRLTCSNPHTGSDNWPSWPWEKIRYRKISEEVLGVTMSWGGDPVPHYRETWECARCGKHLTRDVIDHPIFRNHAKDKKGWPLNEDGTRMEIAA